VCHTHAITINKTSSGAFRLLPSGNRGTERLSRLCSLARNVRV
jgi:hypothetical protein